MQEADILNMESSPAHPGEMLYELYLKPLGMSQSDLAERTGMPLQRVNMIVNGRRAMTAASALRIAPVLGCRPEFLLDLQRNYDLWHAAEDLRRTA